MQTQIQSVFVHTAACYIFIYQFGFRTVGVGLALFTSNLYILIVNLWRTKTKNQTGEEGVFVGRICIVIVVELTQFYRNR